MPKSNKQRKKEIKEKRLKKAVSVQPNNYTSRIRAYLIDFDPTKTTDLSSLSIEMQEIIRTAYTIFSQYSPPEKFSACTACCMTIEEEQALRTFPLQSLPRELIYSYNDSAKYPISGKGEVAYLLPRMLELIALNEDIHFCPELNLCWLEQIPYSDWLVEEKAILERFALQYFTNIFKEADQNQQLICIDEYLIMFYRVGIPITAIFEYISTNYNFYTIITIAFIIGYKENNDLFFDNSFADICPNINIIFGLWLKENIKTLKQYATQAILNPEPLKDISNKINFYIEQGLCNLSNGIY